MYNFSLLAINNIYGLYRQTQIIRSGEALPNFETERWPFAAAFKIVVDEIFKNLTVIEYQMLVGGSTPWQYMNALVHQTPIAEDTDTDNYALVSATYAESLRKYKAAISARLQEKYKPDPKDIFISKRADVFSVRSKGHDNNIVQHIDVFCNFQVFINQTGDIIYSSDIPTHAEDFKKFLFEHKIICYTNKLDLLVEQSNIYVQRIMAAKASSTYNAEFQKEQEGTEEYSAFKKLAFVLKSFAKPFMANKHFDYGSAKFFNDLFLDESNNPLFEMLTDRMHEHYGSLFPNRIQAKEHIGKIASIAKREVDNASAEEKLQYAEKREKELKKSAAQARENSKALAADLQQVLQESQGKDSHINHLLTQNYQQTADNHQAKMSVMMYAKHNYQLTEKLNLDHKMFQSMLESASAEKSELINQNNLAKQEAQKLKAENEIFISQHQKESEAQAEQIKKLEAEILSLKEQPKPSAPATPPNLPHEREVQYQANEKKYLKQIADLKKEMQSLQQKARALEENAKSEKEFKRQNQIEHDQLKNKLEEMENTNKELEESLKNVQAQLMLAKEEVDNIKNNNNNNSNVHTEDSLSNTAPKKKNKHKKKTEIIPEPTPEVVPVEIVTVPDTRPVPAQVIHALLKMIAPKAPEEEIKAIAESDEKVAKFVFGHVESGFVEVAISLYGHFLNAHKNAPSKKFAQQEAIELVMTFLPQAESIMGQVDMKATAYFNLLKKYIGSLILFLRSTFIKNMDKETIAKLLSEAEAVQACLTSLDRFFSNVQFLTDVYKMVYDVDANKQGKNIDMLAHNVRSHAVFSDHDLRNDEVKLALKIFGHQVSEAFHSLIATKIAIQKHMVTPQAPAPLDGKKLFFGLWKLLFNVTDDGIVVGNVHEIFTELARKTALSPDEVLWFHFTSIRVLATSELTGLRPREIPLDHELYQKISPLLNHEFMTSLIKHKNEKKLDELIAPQIEKAKLYLLESNSLGFDQLMFQENPDHVKRILFNIMKFYRSGTVIEREPDYNKVAERIQKRINYVQIPVYKPPHPPQFLLPPTRANAVPAFLGDLAVARVNWNNMNPVDVSSMVVSEQLVKCLAKKWGSKNPVVLGSQNLTEWVSLSNQCFGNPHEEAFEYYTKIYSDIMLSVIDLKEDFTSSDIFDIVSKLRLEDDIYTRDEVPLNLEDMFSRFDLFLKLLLKFLQAPCLERAFSGEDNLKTALVALRSKLTRIPNVIFEQNHDLIKELQASITRAEPTFTRTVTTFSRNSTTSEKSSLTPGLKKNN